MSTYYAVRLSLEDFVSFAKAKGWNETKDGEGGFALVSAEGHYCHYIKEFPGQDNLTWTTFARFGGNTDVHALACTVGALSEHDDDWDQI